MRDEERSFAADVDGLRTAPGCVLVLIGAGAVGLGLLAGFLASLVSEGWRTGGMVFGGVVALVAGALFFRRFVRTERAFRKRLDTDLAGGEVEEIVVECDEAIELDLEDSSLAPALVFDIGDDKLLVIAGGSLRNTTLYGSDDQLVDDDALEGFEDVWWNGLRPPHAFPARRFTLVRLPMTGDVISLTPGGDYLAPARTIAFDLGRYNPQPSQIVKGTLDDLDKALPARPD